MGAGRNASFTHQISTPNLGWTWLFSVEGPFARRVVIPGLIIPRVERMTNWRNFKLVSGLQSIVSVSWDLCASSALWILWLTREKTTLKLGSVGLWLFGSLRWFRIPNDSKQIKAFGSSLLCFDIPTISRERKKILKRFTMTFKSGTS